MSELLQKISSYHILNYLLSGVIFCVCIEYFSCFAVLQHDNLFFDSFVYYFIGLIISRIGSIVIEPLLLKTNFVRYSKYEDYVKATKDDTKIEILLETNNMYRTFTSVFLVFGLVKVYECVARCLEFEPINKVALITLFIGVFLLFLFAYKKQSDYIDKRIESYKKNKRGQ